MQKICPFDLPGHPYKILQAMNAPDSLYNWASKVADEKFVLKSVENMEIPDLESRSKNHRRNSGQFYTPESFSKQIVAAANPPLGGEVLDPACGDGSFLMAAAQMLQSKKPGNRLNLDRFTGYDIDNKALLVSLARLKTLEGAIGWPRLYCDNFLTCTINQRFDLILGNPPYKVNLPAETKQYLVEKYETAEGEKDLYTFFIERSVKLLKNKGFLLMLISNTFLVNHQCKLIRQFVFSRKVKSIYLLPARFFVKAPGVLPVVIYLCASANRESGNRVQIFSKYSTREKTWEEKYVVNSVSLLDGSGLRKAIVPDRLKSVFKKLEGFPTLSEFCKVGVGIQESTKRSGSISKYVTDKKYTSRHRPVLKGREISAFKINWGKKYIDYGDHLAYKGDEKIFNAPKILYQNIRNEKLKQRLVAAYDDKGFFPKNSLSFVLPISENVSFAYLEAVLNSVLINAWFSGHFHSFHVTVTQVKRIPLAIPSLELVRKIEDIVKNIRLVSVHQPEWNDYRQKLDLLICEAYLGRGRHAELLRSCEIFLEQAAAL
ncbi:MAG: hypothetical protein Kow0029_29690 [Candidatus Rifleibacteriota bacterium]